MKGQDQYSGSANCTRIRYLIGLSVCTFIGLIYFNFTPQLKSSEPPTVVVCQNPPPILTQSPVTNEIKTNQSVEVEDTLHRFLKIFDKLGEQYQGNQTDYSTIKRSLAMLKKLLGGEPETLTKEIVLQVNRKNYGDIEENGKLMNRQIKDFGKDKVKINLAVVACGQRKEEALVMLKTAIMFSQDAHLHIILFSDKDTILDLASSLLKLKWTTNALGWDLTFELHLDWFPKDEKTKWKALWVPCSTQRLFFPSLLPHIDSVIYLDSDIIVLSNLTEFWDHFDLYMKDTRIAGMAPNNELTADGWYNEVSKVPYYGKRGLNAGVMLMNLKLMRDFDFEEKSISIQKVYKEKIELADQDILNSLFHGFPEKLHLLNCSYNFNWVHCGYGESQECYRVSSPKSYCFCNATKTNGIQLLHGNGHTFYNAKDFPFLVEIFSQLTKFDLLQTSYSDLFKSLRASFMRSGRPCHPLTEDILYNNANKYFGQLGFPMELK